MNEMLLGTIAGASCGLAFNRVSVLQVKKRTSDCEKIRKVNCAAAAAVSVILSALLFALIFRLYGDWAVRIEYAAYVSIAITIGVVDLDLKKIPNLSVLALIIVRTAAIIRALIIGDSAKATLVPALAGLIVTFILFQLPKLIGIPVGTGDVKFASAIGYCLGVFGFLQSAIIMAAGLALLLVYYKATKKGNIKTRVPMGPFLALGFITTLLFPLMTGLSGLIFPH